MSLSWNPNPTPTRKTWVVQHAGELAELERALNHFEEEGFRLHSLYQLLMGALDAEAPIGSAPKIPGSFSSTQMKL